MVVAAVEAKTTLSSVPKVAATTRRYIRAGSRIKCVTSPFVLRRFFMSELTVASTTAATYFVEKDTGLGMRHGFRERFGWLIWS